MDIPSDNPFSEIIAEFYQVFDYPAPTVNLMNVCDCGGCMQSDFEQKILATPLHELKQKHIYEYLTCALSEPKNLNELKYFFPKIIELFCCGEKLHWETELVFRIMKNGVANHFSAAEKDIWHWFCMQYLTAMIRIYPYEYPVWKQDDDIFVCLLAFHMGGADIRPFLDFWTTQNTPQSTLNYVFSAYQNYWYKRYRFPVIYEIDNHFADDYPEFKTIMKNWLDNPHNKKHFVNCLLNLNQDDIDKLYAEYADIDLYVYGSVEYTFDVLTD